jgi:hypothetical protein
MITHFLGTSYGPQKGESQYPGLSVSSSARPATRATGRSAHPDGTYRGADGVVERFGVTRGCFGFALCFRGEAP